MKVSVCIPVYNRKGVLGAIQSALDQDVECLEVVVVDNCSDDGTWELLQSVTDARVILFRNPTNIGMVNNFSRACDLGQGDYVMLLCSDDKLRPGFLRHAVARMQAEPGAALLSSVGRFVDPDGKFLFYNKNRKISPGLYDGASARRAFFEFTGRYRSSIFNYPAGILMRGDAYRASSPFRAELGDPADADMWMRCLQHGSFLVTGYEGCDIARHQNQRGSESYKVARYFDELIGFAHAQLGGEDDGKTLRRFLHLLAGIGMDWTLRSLAGGNFTAPQTIRKFGWGWGEMTVAYFEHMSYRALAKLGYYVMPSLRRISSN